MVASGVSVGGCIRDDPIVGSRRDSQTQTPNQWVQSEGPRSLKESQEVKLGGRWVFELPLAQTLAKFVDRRS
jgi:hypothetical protein